MQIIVSKVGSLTVLFPPHVGRILVVKIGEAQSTRSKRACVNMQDPVTVNSEQFVFSIFDAFLDLALVYAKVLVFDISHRLQGIYGRRK